MRLASLGLLNAYESSGIDYGVFYLRLTQFLRLWNDVYLVDFLTDGKLRLIGVVETQITVRDESTFNVERIIDLSLLPDIVRMWYTIYFPFLHWWYS